MRKRCRQSFADLIVPRLKTSSCAQIRLNPPRARPAFRWDAPKTADPAWVLTVAEKVPQWAHVLLVQTRVLLEIALLATVPPRVTVLPQATVLPLLLPTPQIATAQPSVVVSQVAPALLPKNSPKPSSPQRFSRIYFSRLANSLSLYISKPGAKIRHRVLTFGIRRDSP